MQQPEEPERERDHGDRADQQLPGRDAAEDDQQLGEKQRRGRHAGERGEADAHRGGGRGAGAGHAGRRPLGGSGIDAQQRQGGVEPERLRERVTGDVEHDARRSPAASRTRSRARSRPCAPGSSTRAGASTASTATGTGPRRAARPARTRGTPRASSPAPTDGSRICLTRQATSSTLGSSAALSSALIGGGASLCASGQPVVDRRPADLRRQPGEQQHEREQGRALRQGVGGEAQRVPVERAEAVVAGVRLADRQHDDPEQRDRQPERREDEVLPARLQRIAAARERDEQRRGGGRRLDDQPGDREVAGRSGPRAAPPRTRTAPRSRGCGSGRRSSSCGRWCAGRPVRRACCTARPRRSPRAAARWRRRRGTSGRAAPAARRARTRSPARISAAAAVGIAVATARRSACRARPGQQRQDRAEQRDARARPRRGSGRRQSRSPRSSSVSPVPSSSWIRVANAAATATTTARSNSAPSSTT